MSDGWYNNGDCAVFITLKRINKGPLLIHFRGGQV